MIKGKKKDKKLKGKKIKVVRESDYRYEDKLGDIFNELQIRYIRLTGWINLSNFYIVMIMLLMVVELIFSVPLLTESLILEEQWIFAVMSLVYIGMFSLSISKYIDESGIDERVKVRKKNGVESYIKEYKASGLNGHFQLLFGSLWIIVSILLPGINIIYHLLLAILHIMYLVKYFKLKRVRKEYKKVLSKMRKEEREITDYSYLDEVGIRQGEYLDRYK